MRTDGVGTAAPFQLHQTQIHADLYFLPAASPVNLAHTQLTRCVFPPPKERTDIAFHNG